MAEENYEKERTLEYTATWSVAVVCFVLITISIIIEHLIDMLEKYLKRKRKIALAEAVEKVKSELMLLGFISLLLTVFQSTISGICIPKKVAQTWLPCNSPYKSTKDTEKYGRRLLEFPDGGGIARRSLATKGYDTCSGEKNELAFVTAYGIHQLHIFIFVLAVFHVLYCITALALGKLKMRAWSVWENEIKSQEYRQFNDPAKFRFTRDTSFGKRHLNFWSRTRISLYLVCFFRQFFGSVAKVDYLTLRHGFITTHFPSGSETRFDFQKYIHRSLEEDFKSIVGISPIIWLIAVIFLLPNVDGSYMHMWLPFVSLFIVLLVGTKLQVIITRMGLRIQEREHVVKGAPVVQLSDDLFWFGKPRLLIFLIHFILFQNAFQLAFFAWSWYEYGFRNCFHKNLADIIIRVSMGIVIHVLCSYVTLPLYALVTQMGSTLKPTIFNEHVAAALKDWHHKAKKHAKNSKHPGNTQSVSNRPVTSEPDDTPSVHNLLHNYQSRSNDSIHLQPDASENTQWEDLDIQNHHVHGGSNEEGSNQPANSMHLPSAPPASHSHDENDISLAEMPSGK